MGNGPSRIWIGPDLVACFPKLNTMDWSEQIKELNDLHELLADGRKGYQEASEHVDRPQLAELFQRLSVQRETMQGELAAEIRRFRPDDRTKDGTAKGVLHQMWMGIREAFGRSDDATMLSACERGDKYLLERYDAVLENPGVDSSCKQLLAIQRGQVQEDLSMFKVMRQSLETVEK